MAQHRYRPTINENGVDPKNDTNETREVVFHLRKYLQVKPNNGIRIQAYSNRGRYDVIEVNQLHRTDRNGIININVFPLHKDDIRQWTDQVRLVVDNAITESLGLYLTLTDQAKDMIHNTQIRYEYKRV